MKNKTAEEWADLIWSDKNDLYESIIKGLNSAMSHARHKALTEASEIARKHAYNFDHAEQGKWASDDIADQIEILNLKETDDNQKIS